MFKPFTLNDIYQMAESYGYAREDVEIEKIVDGVDDDGNELSCYYTVSFGNPYGKNWYWEFDDLDGVATHYEFSECED